MTRDAKYGYFPDNALPSTYVSTFLNTLVNNETCLGPVSTNYRKTPDLCLQVDSCNWAQCDSLTNNLCRQRKLNIYLPFLAINGVFDINRELSAAK